MTQKEIEEIMNKVELEMKANPSWRKGQTYWNVTESYVYEKGNPEQINRFEEIRASEKDCFYVDEKVEVFLEALVNV